MLPELSITNTTSKTSYRLQSKRRKENHEISYGHHGRLTCPLLRFNCVSFPWTKQYIRKSLHQITYTIHIYLCHLYVVIPN